MAVTINGSAGVTTNSGAVYNSIQSDTAKTATGTSVDFTSIPSWVKRITVMFTGVSTNSTSPPQIQLGDSGGIENTGYLGSNSIIGASGVVTATFTSGFGIGVATSQWSAASTLNGAITINLLSSNLWSCFGVTSNSASAGTYITSGSKTLSDVLTQIRITTVNGTDTFDAGSINILYE
jgi:hypothetical protein